MSRDVFTIAQKNILQYLILGMIQNGTNTGYERKNATPLVDWIKVIANSENAKYMPSDSSFELSHFEDFMDKRQKLMSDALKAILL